MRLTKRTVAAVLLIALALPLAGCWDRFELENQHFILTMGIDKRPGGGYVVTLQLAKPNVIAGGGEGGGDSGTSAGGLIMSIESVSLVGAVHELETVSDRRLNFSHIKGILVGEEVAKEGMAIELSSMSRFPQSRRSVFVGIVLGEAQEVLHQLHPIIESNPGKYIEEMLASHRYTGLLPRSQLHNVLGEMENPTRDALVAIVAVNRMAIEQHELEPSSGPLPSEGNVYAGEHRRVGGIPIEFTGSAMMSGDRLVGLLTGRETQMALMLRGEFRRGFMSFAEPGGNERVVLDLRRGRNTETTVKWNGDEPEITVRVRLEAEIVEIHSEIDWSDPTLSQKLSDAVTEELKLLATDLIAKAQEAGADIFGFGDSIRLAFPTWNALTEYGWLARFPDVKITPDVKVTVRRTGLVLDPAHPVDGSRPAESLDGWHLMPGPPVEQQVQPRQRGGEGGE